MSTSEINDKNVVMASFDDVPEEVRKAFEECKKAQEEKEMHELFACYAKDHQKIIVVPSCKSRSLFFLRSTPQKRYTQQRYHIHLPLSPLRMSLLCFLSLLNSVGIW
jgi:hypothetical protein